MGESNLSSSGMWLTVHHIQNAVPPGVSMQMSFFPSDSHTLLPHSVIKILFEEKGLHHLKSQVFRFLTVVRNPDHFHLMKRFYHSNYTYRLQETNIDDTPFIMTQFASGWLMCSGLVDEKRDM